MVDHKVSEKGVDALNDRDRNALGPSVIPVEMQRAENGEQELA